MATASKKKVVRATAATKKPAAKKAAPKAKPAAFDAEEDDENPTSSAHELKRSIKSILTVEDL